MTYGKLHFTSVTKRHFFMKNIFFHGFCNFFNGSFLYNKSWFENCIKIKRFTGCFWHITIYSTIKKYEIHYLFKRNRYFPL